jgi:hypothetical protein
MLGEQSVGVCTTHTEELILKRKLRSIFGTLLHGDQYGGESMSLRGAQVGCGPVG